MLNSVTAEFRASLGEVLPDESFPDLGPDYLEEQRGLYRGNGGLLVAPGTVQQVAEVVRRGAQARIPIVPYSGGTGLVGGQIISDGPQPVILSLRRMARIREILPVENVVVAEAGAILADVSRGRVDGLIMQAPLTGDRRIGMLTELGLPFVVHGRVSDHDESYSWLDMDNFHAFYRATLDAATREVGT